MGKAPGGELPPLDAKGGFKRPDSAFRNVVSKGGEYPPEAGRYHLYVAYGCPWANRCLSVLHMKGLQDVIGLSIVHGTMQKTRPEDPEDDHVGWVFTKPDDPPLSAPAGHGSFPGEGTIPDTVNGAKTIRELYERVTKGEYKGRYSVPVFWDKKTGGIVNNESAEIIRFLNSEFNELARHPELDLYPEQLRKQIDEVNDWVYRDINNGVYKCGFAQTQAGYDEAFDALFEALDRCEAILSQQRYLAGSQLTEADVRLFMTLVRFDEVYYVYFKTNRTAIREFPNLSEYVKDMYQTPGIAETVNMAHIKSSYFSSHAWLNQFAIVPKGKGADFKKYLSSSHDRARFSH